MVPWRNPFISMPPTVVSVEAFSERSATAH
jgi:hypothetical protein